MDINEKTIAVYRDVYYEHVKLLIKKGATAEEINETILPVLVLYGWTLKMYHDFSTLDLMQSGLHRRYTKVEGEEGKHFSYGC